jgi:HD-GYP domain-containing protein (c-di-GMP phosphodiesterase class II)
MLSESTTALLNSETESILLSEYCRIAVETGGYLMAWVGVAEDDNDKSVKSIERFGRDEGYLEAANITWAEGDLGNGAVGRAIRSKQVQFIENFATSLIGTPWRDEALKRGYQSCVAIPFMLWNGMMACLALYSSKAIVWSTPELELLQQIGADLAFGIAALQTAVSKIHYQVSLRESLEQTIQVIADTGEERDAYTAGHQRRVADLSARIATELGFAEDRIHGLHLAASIHDLGKIGIPVEILTKPRRLTAMEFGIIKEHPTIAFNILKSVNFPWPIAKTILQHHERIDGSGYPLGLKGDDILMESKILSVADVVEAMASHRPYRLALGIEAALSEITKQRGITLDAEAVDACLRVFNEQDYKFENQ